MDIVEVFNDDATRLGRYRCSDPRSASCTYIKAQMNRVTKNAYYFDRKRVLDVGCGDGYQTIQLRTTTNATVIVGIDPAKNAIEIAKSLYAQVARLEFREGFINNILERRERFDVVLFRACLHHTLDPSEEIRTAFQIARSLVIIEPNGWNPILKVIERMSPYHRAHMERSHLPGTYKRWIEDAGGKVVSVRFFGLVPVLGPDWFVPIGGALEPLVERIPLMRRGLCGQFVIRAERAGA